MSDQSSRIQVLLSCSFRPFFLLGALCAVYVMLIWSLAILGYGPMVGHPNQIFWHAHEMIFGFLLAIIAGFTLTAAANWTGRPPVSGAPLALLVAAWLAGRVAMIYIGDWPMPLAALTDMLFPVLLTGLFAREILAAGNKRNLPVVFIVGLLAALNALFHYGFQQPNWLDRTALLLAIHVILVLVTVISGRIIPSFTGNWLRLYQKTDGGLPRSFPLLDGAVALMTVVTGVAVVFATTSILTAAAAFITAALHAARLSQWKGFKTTEEPLMFVLHVAYFWLPAGYALTGAAVLGHYFPTVALHVLTIGAISNMVLAMITRVPLGHTGRPLHASRAIVMVYLMMVIAVLFRLAGPWTGDFYIKSVETAASFWIILFLVFLWVYWPILSKPGVDETA
jgi:uncharacterized protein involved in response to NO